MAPKAASPKVASAKAVASKGVPKKSYKCTKIVLFCYIDYPPTFNDVSISRVARIYIHVVAATDSQCVASAALFALMHSGLARQQRKFIDARSPPRVSGRGRRARCTRDGPSSAPRPADAPPASDDNDDRRSVPVCPDRAAVADAEAWGFWTTSTSRTSCATELQSCKMPLPSCVPWCGGRLCNRFDACKGHRQPTAPLAAPRLLGRGRCSCSRPAFCLPAQSNEARKRVPNCWGWATAFQRGEWLQPLQAARRVSRPATTPRFYPPTKSPNASGTKLAKSGRVNCHAYVKC